MYKYNNTSCKGQLLTILSCGNPTEKRGGGVIGGGGGVKKRECKDGKTVDKRKLYLGVVLRQALCKVSFCSLSLR